MVTFVWFQPERIDPSASRQGYDVRSDVWSLGITLVSFKLVPEAETSLSVCRPAGFARGFIGCVPDRVLQYELATGRFPYPKWNSVFDQLTQVVRGDPPQLSNSEERRFSPKFIFFVNVW